MLPRASMGGKSRRSMGGAAGGGAGAGGGKRARARHSIAPGSTARPASSSRCVLESIYAAIAPIGVTLLCKAFSW